MMAGVTAPEGEGVNQPMVGVGLIGSGAIAGELARAVDCGRIKNASLLVLFDVDDAMSTRLSRDLPSHPIVASSFNQFLQFPGLTLVVEAASQKAVQAYAEEVLSQGMDLMTMSSGALTDSALFQKLSEAAQRHNRRVLVPSGALGGIDAIRAARDGLEEVVITTRKPPDSFRGAPGFKEWESKEITSPQLLYEGPAHEAVRLYPANVNVAATLSLAGLGPARTTVRILADPDAKGNVHEIFARGKFGTLRFIMENVPHPNNPKTSYLAALSAIETLRSACEPGVRIGA